MTTTTNENRLDDIKHMLDVNQEVIDAHLKVKDNLTKYLVATFSVEIDNDADLTNVRNDYIDALKTTMVELKQLQDRRAILKAEKRALTTCDHCGRHN